MKTHLIVSYSLRKERFCIYLHTPRHLSVLFIAKSLSSWMHENKIIKCLRRSKQTVRNDMRYAVFCAVIWRTLHLFFLLFHFIFELHSISMVMINNVKNELINATENCLLNNFSARHFFYQVNNSLSIPFSCDQDQGV